MKKGDERGQTTIFIIIAIVIVALAFLFYFLFPGIRTTTSFDVNNPEAFLQNCIQKEINEVEQNLSLQGGSLMPEHYYLYNDSKLTYLCYNEENYLPCVVQKPLLIQDFRGEMESAIRPRVNECLTTLKENYESKGYSVTLSNQGFNVELLPKRIVVMSNSTLSVSKEDTRTYDRFSIAVNNNIYELLTIANSIVSMEAHYGDSETTTYMNYYRDLKVEKYKQSEGTTVYILTDRNNGHKFQFASRSLAWPPGYERWK